MINNEIYINNIISVEEKLVFRNPIQLVIGMKLVHGGFMNRDIKDSEVHDPFLLDFPGKNEVACVNKKKNISTGIYEKLEVYDELEKEKLGNIGVSSKSLLGTGLIGDCLSKISESSPLYKHFFSDGRETERLLPMMKLSDAQEQRTTTK